MSPAGGSKAVSSGKFGTICMFFRLGGFSEGVFGLIYAPRRTSCNQVRLLEKLTFATLQVRGSRKDAAALTLMLAVFIQTSKSEKRAKTRGFAGRTKRIRAFGIRKGWGGIGPPSA